MEADGGGGGGAEAEEDHGHEGQRRGEASSKDSRFCYETKYVPAYFTLTKFVGRFESASGRSKVRGTA